MSMMIRRLGPSDVAFRIMTLSWSWKSAAGV
jgi:hypothetical protein